MTTRKDTITEFVAGWAGGLWDSHAGTQMEAVQRLADQAVAYADIADTSENRLAYSRTVREMVGAGTLNSFKLYDGNWYFEVV